MNIFKQLDSLLRGQRTTPDSLGGGANGLSARTFGAASLALGAAYGAFVGLFSVIGRPEPNWHQLLASIIKIPLLFLLTLFVTLPSLYVFSALMGCRLSFHAVLRLLVATIAVNLALAASLGPILGFFTLSTTSYPFMVVLNVLLLATAGIVALGFLMRTLRRLDESSITPESPAPADMNTGINTSPEQPRPEPSSRAVFAIWIILYGLVGAQMGWILRPFIGNPDLAFQWFRPRTGNFFASLLHHLGRLFDLMM